MICELCNIEVKSQKSLALHINNKHPETNQEQYFIKFMSIDNEHLCKSCGKPNKFRGLAKRCGTYCSTKCMANSKDIQGKRKDTIFEKHGVENISQIPSVKEKKIQINRDKFGVDFVFQAKEIKDKIKSTMQERHGVDNPMQSLDLKEKQQQSLFDNFGVLNPRQSKIIQDRAKITIKEKHGVEYYSQTDEYKEKTQSTNMKNFGYTHPMYSPKVKEKLKLTNLENTGFENPLLNPKVQEKVMNTNIERYGVQYPLQNKDIYNKLIKNLSDKYGVENIFQLKRVKEIIYYKNIKNFYNKLFNSDRLKNKVKPLFSLGEYKGVDKNKKYNFECIECSNIFMDTLDNGKVPRCLNCYPYTTGFSIQEKEVYNFIRSLLPDNVEILENCRNIISPLELDIYIPTYNLAIEFNGLYWHSESKGKNKNYHAHKTQLCKNKDIKLIQIFEDEWFNKQNIVKSIIINKLGLSKNKIFARKCTIKKLNNKEVIDFLDDNHIQGFILGKNFGLLYNNELVSVLTMGTSRYDKNYDWEILRFCSKLNTNVIGGFSKLFKYFRSLYSGTVMTYADLRYGTGKVYETIGFKYIKTTSPNYYYIDKESVSRYSRQKFQKHKLPNILENFDERLTEWQNMQLNGYDRIWDCGNNVFVLS